MGISLNTIPAKSGKAVYMTNGQTIKIINTHGKQVIDTWAFNANDLGEYMSMEHSRTTILKLIPSIGDVLNTNKRNPILTFMEDTSPGIHDAVISACDNERYQLLGHKGYHRNCSDNLIEAMADLKLSFKQRGTPLNLFMNIPWDSKGNLKFAEPVSKPGDYVTFKAEMDAVLAFSACPQDILLINGPERNPTEAHYQIYD
tara:strand:- start:258 stop:860 length:603 start_codon:yes stop_codon:yes gene_type:complete